jgi:hypothetical protein
MKRVRQYPNVRRDSIEKLQIGFFIENAGEGLFDEVGSIAALHQQLPQCIRIDAILIVSDCGARQHRREIQKIRRDNRLAHRLQQIRDAPTAGEWVCRSLKVKAV